MPTPSRTAAALALLALLTLCGCAALSPEFQSSEDGAARVTVEMRGRQALGAQELRREIEDYMLDLSRRPDQDGPAFDAADRLAEAYRAQGYADVEVDYRVRRASGAVAVEFSIREGPQVVVSPPLAFDGAHAFEPSELRALWVRRASGLLGFGAPLFVAVELDDLAAEVARYYRAHGFLDVEVDPPQVARAPGSKTAAVHIAVREGDRYRFGNTTFDAALVEQMEQSAPAPPSGEYAPGAVQDYGLTLGTYLRQRGFPEPKLRARATPDRTQHRVDVHIEGAPGRRAVVGEVRVSGNAETRTSLIRGKLGLEPGEQYDGAVEEAGLRRLYLCGLFNKVTLKHEWLDDDRVAVVVQVEELPTRSLELLAGYGSYEQLRGGVRLEEQNLFGAGLQGTVLGRISQRGYRTGASLTEPDLFGTDTSLTLSGEFFRREEPSFTDEALGTTLSLSRTLAPGLTLRTGYGFRDHADAFAEVVDPQSRLVDYRDGHVFVDLHSDQRDNPLFPTSGHDEFATYEVTSRALGADVAFTRLRVGGSVHVPLFDPLRLVLRSEQGWLWPGEGSAAVPLQERFFAGGESSVRSFRESRLGPLDPNGAPIGGEYRNLFGAELRVPVWKTFELAGFADAGNVGREVQEYGLANLRYGIGAGLRLVLPIGPVRLDFAYNPDREPGEAAWVTHFSVGYPF